MRLAWTGDPGAGHELQYDVGAGAHRLQGGLTVGGTDKEFGPLSEAVWDVLPLYNPFRFRVRDARCRAEACWSAWASFNVATPR